MIVLITDHFSNSAEMLKFHGKWQISWLGSKFRSPKKIVGPTNVYSIVISRRKNICTPAPVTGVGWVWPCKNLPL